jgi:uncharacterized membrane protein YhhN
MRADASGLWLGALFVAWAVLLFGGFAFGPLDASRQGHMPTWTRMLSSLVLAVAAWSWYAFLAAASTREFSLFIALGMTLGLVGDLVLARLLPLAQPVLLGMAAFGLGHIAYITAILSFGQSRHLVAPVPLVTAWIVWLLIGVAGWYLVVFRGHAPTALHWAALPYALLLASTAGVATGLALRTPVLVPLAIGAILFLASDLVLAGGLFGAIHVAFINDIIWLTYGPGQMLIVFGAILAASMLPG